MYSNRRLPLYLNILRPLGVRLVNLLVLSRIHPEEGLGDLLGQANRYDGGAVLDLDNKLVRRKAHARELSRGAGGGGMA